MIWAKGFIEGIMRRLALALALLLAGCLGGDMGKCDIEYTLLLPDDAEFDFSGPGYIVGTGSSVQGHEGFGLPPVEHVTQEVYDMPGALLRDITVQPRVVTITLSVWATDATRYGLHKTRAAIMNAMRWDRGPSKTSPSTLRYTINGTSRDLYVNYAGDVASPQGRFGRNEVVGIRFMAYDPMWYDPDTEEQVLDFIDSFTYRCVASKTAGVWDSMGPPANVIAGAGGNIGIYAITVSPDGRYVYFGGDFQNFDNIGAADHIVRWDTVARTWAAVGGGLNHIVRRIYFGPDGTLYVVGSFTNGSGGVGDPLADNIAQYDVATNTWVNFAGGPGVGVITYMTDILIGADGTMYVSGNFTNWAATGANHIVKWTLVGGWAVVSAGQPNAAVEALVMLPNGNIVIAGAFTLIAAVTYNRVAEWDPVAAAWSALGTGLDNIARSAVIGLDGTVYVCGDFTTAGGVAALRAAKWNGSAWSAMGDGLSASAVKMFVNPTNGEIYVTGSFTNVASVPFADYIAKWNGSAWIPIDIIIPAPAAIAPRFTFDSAGNLYLGIEGAGTLSCGADNSVVNAGSAFSLPIVEIKNAGVVGIIRNETTEQEIPCNMPMFDGEIVTIDLSTGKKSCESNWRGNRLGSILPGDDTGSFKLESHPRADYGGTEGANLITVFITGAAAREHNDGGNQLSGWDNVTGISQDNTNLGILYASIVAGVTNHVNLYMDAARTLLVGHTVNYNAVGAKAIIADNASGLGGTITVDAGGWPGANDVDIYVYYTIVTMTWRNRWWDLDNAVTT